MIGNQHMIKSFKKGYVSFKTNANGERDVFVRIFLTEFSAGRNIDEKDKILLHAFWSTSEDNTFQELENTRTKKIPPRYINYMLEATDVHQDFNIMRTFEIYLFHNKPIFETFSKDEDELGEYHVGRYARGMGFNTENYRIPVKHNDPICPQSRST